MPRTTNAHAQRLHLVLISVGPALMIASRTTVTPLLPAHAVWCTPSGQHSTRRRCAVRLPGRQASFPRVPEGLADGVEMLGLTEEQGQADPPRHGPYRIAGSSSLGCAVFLTGLGLAADIARTLKR
jgi:hypothetical protein